MLLAALLLLTACAPRSEIRRAQPLGPIEPPRFELVPGRTRIERFDPPGAGGGLELAVAALVSNPNDFPVELERLEYTVRLAGQAVAQGVLLPALRLAPGDREALNFTVDTEVGRRPELLRAVVGAFADAPLDFALEGRLEFSSPGFAFVTRVLPLASAPVSARETVQPPQLLLDEADSEVYELQAGVPVVRVVVQAVNPGDVGYFLYGRDLQLRLAGELVALEDLPPSPLPAGEPSRIDLLFYPDETLLAPAAVRALEAALQGIPTNLELSGQLWMDVLGIDTFAVPSAWRVVGFVDADR